MAAPRVFVSHSHKDDAFTTRLVADLRAAGAEVWVDTTDMHYGDFVDRINDALVRSEWLVLVLTPDALASPYVKREVNATINRLDQGQMSAVIPILAAPCDRATIPPLWANLHRYDATTDYGRALTSLLSAIGIALTPSTLKSPAPPSREPSISPPYRLFRSRLLPRSPNHSLEESALGGGTVVGYGERVDMGGWRNLPPKDDVFTDEADRVADNAALAITEEFKGSPLARKTKWAVVGASRRGLSHKHDGKFREDSLEGDAVNGWQIAVVTDGGGSYKLARVGAQVAAKAALAAMRAVAERQKNPDDGLAERVMCAMLRQGLQEGYDALYAEGRQREVGWSPASVKDLRTTLLLAVHRDLGNDEHLVGGAQVGDGIVVARASNERLEHDSSKLGLLWLGRPDTGPNGNEVLFLQDVKPDEWREDQPREKDRVIVKRVVGKYVYCLAMTAGVTDDFEPNDQNLWRLEKTLFDSALTGDDVGKAAEKLGTLLNYERDDSFDDRTLACIYRVGDAPWT